MSRLTRKPRLFGFPARHVAGAGAMLLALASPLAGARNVSQEAMPPLRDPHGDETPFATEGAGKAASPANAPAVAGPLGWTAAGVLLALALWPPGAARSTEGA